MKFDLQSIRADRDNFMVHEHQFAGETVYLVQPVHIGTTWTFPTLNRRSVVVNAEGELLSASFKKFFNWDEKPEIDPLPKSLDDSQLMEKLDGSTLIWSRYKGHTMVRTRGTVDASTQPLNGHEIDVLKQKYAKFVTFLEATPTCPTSYLFEWTSPLNRIVISYGDEVEMTFIGAIDHRDYSYYGQSHLDQIAGMFAFKRPRSFSYNSIDEMKAAVEQFKGIEGLCVYYNGGQSIRKVKGAEYLYLHRAKSDVSSIEKVLDLYLNHSETLGHHASYQEFMAYIEKAYDYEIANLARGHVSRIADGMKEVNLIVDGMKKFAAGLGVVIVGGYTVTLNPKQVRKASAERIFQAYGSTGRSAMLFKMYDGKTLDSEDYKKLLFQVMKD
jgi:hypothetical protein